MYPVRERQWEKDLLRIQYRINTPPKKFNMDIQNDGLEKVDGPLKSGNFWYLCYGMNWLIGPHGTCHVGWLLDAFLGALRLLEDF